QTQDLQPLGWSLVEIGIPSSLGTLVPARTLDGVLPGGSAEIRVSSFLESDIVYPRSGTVYRHLSPVWADPDGNRLVTRLSKNETVAILGKETWRINRGNIAHLYYIEDNLGNRGYVGSDTLVLPLANFGNFTVSILETFSLELISEVPWNQHRVFGRPRNLPVIQGEGKFFAVVPQDEDNSLNLGHGKNTHLIMGSAHETLGTSPLFMVASFQILPDNTSVLSFTGFFFDQSKPQTILQESIRVPYQIREVSTPRFLNPLSQFYPLSDSRISSDLGFVLEYSGASAKGIHAEVRGWPLTTKAKSSALLEFSLPLDSLVQNNEPLAALRQGPSQSFGLVRRLTYGTLIEPIELHIPSSIVQNVRGFWARVAVEEDQGWIWGNFLGGLRQ
ncbi:MAG: SH3 domain-containing protein, partial [Spirochaetales bacterium]|nr:SH3 domain-containing protein [Spirochaetales bacterium]